MEDVARTEIELGIAARASAGESTSGDIYVVKGTSSGVLIAAVDGIGHGTDAASAARTAASVLEAHADEPVLSLVRRCHDALRGTRGVVLSIASLNAAHGLLTWVGVGNVQGTLLRLRPGPDGAEESLLLRSGIVGRETLPALRAEVLCVSPGDTLVLATDGIGSDFSRDLARNLPPQRAADGVLEQHGRTSDDALVIVTRFLGQRARG